MTPTSDKVREQQIGELNTQLMTAREEVNDKRARLEQARHVIDTNGDIGSIAELAASAAIIEQIGPIRSTPMAFTALAFIRSLQP